MLEFPSNRRPGRATQKLRTTHDSLCSWGSGQLVRCLLRLQLEAVSVVPRPERIVRHITKTRDVRHMPGGRIADSIQKKRLPKAMEPGSQIPARKARRRSRIPTLVLAALLAYPSTFACACLRAGASDHDCSPQETGLSLATYSISAYCCVVNESASHPRILRSQGLNDTPASSQELPAQGLKPVALSTSHDRHFSSALSPPIPPLLRSCILLI